VAAAVAPIASADPSPNPPSVRAVVTAIIPMITTPVALPLPAILDTLQFRLTSFAIE